MTVVKIEGHLANTVAEVAEWLSVARGIAMESYGADDVPDAILVKLIELLAAKTMVTLQAQPAQLDPSMAALLRSGGGGR